MKHYGLLQCFSAWFFFLLFFFVMIFSKIFFVNFIFLILSWLRIYFYSFFLENIMDCNRFSPYNFYFIFFYKFTIIYKHVISRQHAGTASNSNLEVGVGISFLFPNKNLYNYRLLLCNYNWVHTLTSKQVTTILYII
jgi:hypothetical protein